MLVGTGEFRRCKRPYVCLHPCVGFPGPPRYLRDFGSLEADGFVARRGDVLGAPLPRAIGVLDWVRDAVAAWRADVQPTGTQATPLPADDLPGAVGAAHPSVFPRLRTMFRLFR